MKGMNDLVRQAQVMQKKIAKLQEELAEKLVEATSGGGMVTVTVTGSQEFKGIKIDPSVVDPNDVPMLEDLILAAAVEAQKKARDMTESEMGTVTGGFKVPGLMGF
jgi:DNA-binding YbaB/EbfC family protein